MQVSPQNNPPLSRDDLVNALKLFYRDQTNPKEMRDRAFQFISNYSVSARDQNWKNEVYNFLFGEKSVTVKTFGASNSPPINGHRFSKGHRG